MDDTHSAGGGGGGDDILAVRLPVTVVVNLTLGRCDFSLASSESVDDVELELLISVSEGR